MTFDAARARETAARAHIALRDPVSLESIHRHLEQQRQRKIVIKPIETVPTDKVCGLWFGLDHMDLILHAPGESEIHRQQIILHEFAHMILLHELETVSPDYARKFFPDLDTDRVVKALKRTDFQDEFEVAAELLADRMSALIRESQERLGGQPNNFGKIFG